MVLLANVFESFRRVYLEDYGLDPLHFYLAPGLAWKACLKKTGVTLQLLLDPDMLLMFERGIRGGIITQSVHRWAEVNNPYMGSEHDESKPIRYLQYLDASNFMVGQYLNRCQLEVYSGLSLERIGILTRLLKNYLLRKIMVICWG